MRRVLLGKGVATFLRGILPRGIFGALVQKIRPRPVHYVIALVILVVGVILGRTQMPLIPRVHNQNAVPAAGPVRIEFGQDVAPSYQIEIKPAVPGKWQQKKSPFGVYEALFVPDKPLAAARSYTVRIAGIKRVFTGQPLPNFEQNITTELAVGIKSISPADNSQDVGMNPKFEVVQSDAKYYPRRLKARLIPETPLKQIQEDGQVLVWEPLHHLEQTRSYTLAIDDVDQPEGKKTVVTSNFNTVIQPKIVSARAGHHLSQGQPINITFDMPMEQTDSGFKFDLPGKGHWESERTYQFVPEGIEPAKKYNYTVKAGTKSKAGGVIEGDRVYEINTNGVVTASLYPGGGVSPNTPMSVAFDQPVDHASAESRFSTSPSLKGSFTWAGNTMIFTPRDSAYSTTYAFSVAPGVKPVWGLPSTARFGQTYSTIAQVVKLSVPLYKQPYGRSCEVTSLRMALAFRGIITSEMSIVNRIGYNPRARDTGANFWDNPNLMFVGFINTFSWTQGYGVHAGPIASAAQSYGRGASAHFGVGASFISQAIHAGNPVIVWGHINPAYADSWNTSSGVVATTTSMHARVVYGVTGSATNPVGFWVHDPWYGSTSYWSAGALLGNMNAVPGVSNQAVVVN